MHIMIYIVVVLITYGAFIVVVVVVVVLVVVEDCVLVLDCGIIVEVWWGRYNSGHLIAHAKFIIYNWDDELLQKLLQKYFRKGSRKVKPNFGILCSIFSSKRSSYNNKKKILILILYNNY